MNLVWSDDPKDKCQKCGKFKVRSVMPGASSIKDPCRCLSEDKIAEANKKDYKFVAIFRMEKNGRGGKTVTVIDGLPKQEIFLKELTKELKEKCGTGGTYLLDGKEGIIEIQGDKRIQVKAIFDKKGFKYKGM